MQSQGAKERNKLSVATTLWYRPNFEDMCCREYFSFLKSDKALLRELDFQKNMHGWKSKSVET